MAALSRRQSGIHHFSRRTGGDSLTLQTDNIPEELRSLPQWVGRRGKIPLNPATGEGAKAGIPSTWGTLEQAVTGVNAGRFEGIGFEFATGGGLVGIDLDHVANPHTGEIQPWALEIVQRMDSYTEYSPSGTGLHIFVHGDIPEAGRKKTINKDTGEAVELYKEKRYFTVTAQPFHPAPIADRAAELTALYAKLFPPQQTHTPPSPAIDAPEYLRIGLDKDRTFRTLWDGYRATSDESSNDLALMNKLAHWCNRDEGRMIEAFLASPHTAGKDDAHRAKLEREDYLHRTAQKAITDCRETAAERDAAYKLERARRECRVRSPSFASFFLRAGKAALLLAAQRRGCRERVDVRHHEVHEQDGVRRALVHVPPEADEARDKPKAHGEDHLAFERGGRGRVVGRHEYGAQQQSA